MRYLIRTDRIRFLRRCEQEGNNHIRHLVDGLKHSEDAKDFVTEFVKLLEQILDSGANVGHIPPLLSSTFQ